MVDFSLMPYGDNLIAEWDAVVRLSKNGNFLHLRGYMGYHAAFFDEQSVIVLKRGRAVAVFPANRLGKEIISHGGLTYGGLIYGDELRSVDTLAIMDLLAAHYRRLGYCLLTYKAIPHIFHRYPAEEDLYALYRLGAALVRRELSTAVYLPCRLKLSDSRKNTIRKAEKQGIEVKESIFFDAFHALLANALLRHGKNPVHSLSELIMLRNRFPAQMRLFGAFQHGKLLAGALIYDFGHVVHSQYLATSDEGKATGALDLILAHLLDHEFSQRDYFSFGISTEENGHYLNEGLVFQKEGFGGRAIVHDFYQLEL